MASGAEEARAGANGIRVPLVDAAADEVQRRPYDKEAAMLFNNMRLPAAIIAGSILPLGFGFPLPMQGVSSGVQQACARAHMLLAVISLGAELVAIVYATVAVNKLTETTAVPATSVMMLLASEVRRACCARATSGKSLPARTWLTRGPARLRLRANVDRSTRRGGLAATSCFS